MRSDLPRHGLLVILLAAFGLASCSRDELVGEVASPSGKYKAVTRNCGQAGGSGYLLQVSVAEAGTRVECMSATYLAGFSVHEDARIELAWESDAVLVAKVPDKEPMYSYGGDPVRIRFESPVPASAPAP